MGYILISLIFIAAAIAFAVLFISNLANTLAAVSPENRSVDPLKTWLIFIPFFGAIWFFVIVRHLANGIEKEFAQHGRQLRNPALYLGYSVGILHTITMILNFVPSHDLTVILLKTSIALVSFTCIIIFWVTISNYKKQMIALKTTAAL